MSRDRFRSYDYACEGLVAAVRRAATPRPSEDPRYPLTLTIPYYGEPVGVAVWWAKFVMREARRLGLYPTTARLEAENRVAC